MTSAAVIRLLWFGWAMLGGVLAACAFALALVSERYWADADLIDMPSIPFAVAFVAAGLIFLFILPLVRRTVEVGLGAHMKLLWLVVLFGLAFRVLLFWSTPAFEDDWYRYLWDGAVTSSGYNPYAVTPDDAQGEPYHYTLQPLARASGVVIERVNHSHLKTIYPPVAQGTFALAHRLSPWSLTAWRAVLLTAEIATLLLLLALLKDAARSPLWSALYWWNPIVVKEIINSAHMEGIVTPLVLGALLLTARSRPLAAMGVLSLAIGAKFWPLMLAPLVLRPLVGRPRQLLAAVAMLIAFCGLWAWPIFAGGLDKTSGFVAFAQHWRTNSAHFPLVQGVIAELLSVLDISQVSSGLMARGLLAVLVGLIAIRVALRPLDGAGDLMTRAGLVTAALFMLSPAQFPWYAIWMIPYLCFRPWLGLLAVTAFVPIYYTAFHFLARDTHELFRSYVVWVIWCPVWSLVAVEAWRRWRKDRTDQTASGARHA